MEAFALAVKKKSSQYGIMDLKMRFVGKTEVGGFLAQAPEYDDTVKAWAAEMKHGHWHSAAALAADYQNIDISDLPSVIFYLESVELRIDTMIDFRRGIVLLVAIAPFAAAEDNPQSFSNAHHDH
jgi:mRNA-degrading endonuclease HigB of HigAB toxin-antitoxin module